MTGLYSPLKREASNDRRAPTSIVCRGFRGRRGQMDAALPPGQYVDLLMGGQALNASLEGQEILRGRLRSCH
jgi:hypothetical protein